MSDVPNLTGDNIQVLYCNQIISWHRYSYTDKDMNDYDTRYLAHGKESAAHSVVGEMISSGAIKFSLSTLDEKTLTRRLEVRAYLVNSDYIKTFDDRVSEKVSGLLNDVLSDVFHEIDHWGSRYRVETISKSDARRLLSEGVRRVIKNLEVPPNGGDPNTI